NVLQFVAHHGQSTEWLESARSLFPHPVSRDLIGGVAILDQKVVHVEDLQNASEFPASQALAKKIGYCTGLCVPMLRGSIPVGAILVFRQKAKPFNETEIALLRTFADQAVIAVNNVGLFREVQARTRDLTEALEQ